MKTFVRLQNICFPIVICGFLPFLFFKSPQETMAETRVQTFDSPLVERLNDLDERLTAVERWLDDRRKTESVAKDQPSLDVPIVAPVQPVELKKTQANYPPRWTHPDTIEQHMAGYHKVDITGKSKADLVREHDAIHDVIGPVTHSKSMATLSVKSYSSNCPGGVCPVPNRSVSTRSVAPVSRPRIFWR
jgi:hypothetical protein